jgi:hypothetical protein
MDPTIEQVANSPSRSRRTLLAGALGGLAAWAAAAIGRATPVAATNGDPVIVGSANIGSTRTIITATAPDEPAVVGLATANPGTSGIGVQGVSGALSGSGVLGEATNTNHNAAGVRGVTASPNGAGVWGQAQTTSNGTTAAGLYGESSATNGFGVIGLSPHLGVVGVSRGTAVQAEALGPGMALRVLGRATFDRTSGVATISAGRTSVAVTPKVAVDAAAFVLVTAHDNIGARSLWVTLNPRAGTFTIRMSSSRSSTTRVAWLLVG